MKKHILKLVNDERANVRIVSRKGCTEEAVDICYVIDAAHCSINAYDICNKDYEACFVKADDICGIDRTNCFGPNVCDNT